MEGNIAYVLPGDISTEASFEHVFKMHFNALHAYANTILKDDIVAEETVQNVFCKLWEKKNELSINQSVSAYLYRSVHNESLNYLKHLKVRGEYQSYALKNTNHTNNISERINLKDFEAKLAKTLNELPEQCRTIFQLSRFEELKYHQIAAKLDISVKTVESQMSKALKILRSKLSEFIPILILILFNK